MFKNSQFNDRSIGKVLKLELKNDRKILLHNTHKTVYIVKNMFLLNISFIYEGEHFSSALNVLNLLNIFC